VEPQAPRYLFLIIVTPMSEADVTVAWIEIYGLIASKGIASRKARMIL
jgi:hypothetical protein